MHPGSPMQQLDKLRRINRALAGLTAVLGLVATAGLVGITAMLWGEVWLLDLIMVGSTLFTAVMVLASVALLLVLGRKVGEGRWRIGQTVLAVMNLGSNPPVGVAYGAYALWVCWVHPASVARFEGHQDPPPDDASDAKGDRYFRITRAIIVGFGALLVLFTLGTLGGVAGLLSWSAQEPGVELTEDSLDIDGLWAVHIDRADITAVTLEDSLPTITARTNGYALGDELRGWFSTEEHGSVKLFVHADVPPFLYIDSGELLVIYSAEQPQDTQALYEALANSP